MKRGVWIKKFTDAKKGPQGAKKKPINAQRVHLKNFRPFSLFTATYTFKYRVQNSTYQRVMNTKIHVLEVAP
jgi:hypothetical protein